MTNFRHFIGVVAFLWLGGTLGTTALGQATPPEQVEAYVMIVKAEQAEKAGDVTGAFEFYAKAFDLYRTVARNYPQWQPNVVRGRITETRNHLDRLQQATPSLKGEDSAALAPDAGAIRLAWEAERSAWEEEKAVFEQVMEDLEKERAALIASNRQVIAAMKRLEKQLAEHTQTLTAQQAAADQNVQAWAVEREALVRQIDTLRLELVQLEEESAELTEALNGLLEIPVLKGEIGRLEEETASLMLALAGMSNLVAEIQTAHDAERTADRATLSELSAERGRLVEQARALKETVDMNQSDMRRVREFRTTIKNLEKENKVAARQIKDLESQLGKAVNDEEKKRQQAQNAVLVEELQVFRARLDASERKVRELERQVAPQR